LLIWYRHKNIYDFFLSLLFFMKTETTKTKKGNWFVTFFDLQLPFQIFPIPFFSLIFSLCFNISYINQTKQITIKQTNKKKQTNKGKKTTNIRNKSAYKK
jgi:hypothetical protein